MKQSTADAIAQTLSVRELLEEIRQDKKLKKQIKEEKVMLNGKEDTGITDDDDFFYDFG